MANQSLDQKTRRLDILDGKDPHSFVIPVKKINEGHDVPAFLTSRAYSDIMTFVLQLNHAMFPRRVAKSKEGPESIQKWDFNNPAIIFSDTVNRLRNLLADLEKIIDRTPPDPGPRRFGNISFRKWAEQVEFQSTALLERYIPADILQVRSSSGRGPYDELASYLLGSFGSSERLDYGTGHELSFLAFLGSIWKLGGFGRSETPGDQERGIVIGVIEPYVDRKIISRDIALITLA